MNTANKILWVFTAVALCAALVWGAWNQHLAQANEGYKASLQLELRNHREDLAACAERDKACTERAKIDRKTIKELTDQRDRLARKIKVGKGATVNITVAP